MIIDGNKINEEIKETLRAKSKDLSLAIVWVGDNPASAKYVEKKQKFGEDVGIRVDVFKYGAAILTSELEVEIKNILAGNPSGIIVQLPLPKQIDAETVLNMLPENKDVDLLSEFSYKNFMAGRSNILPPVVASIKEILDRAGIFDLRHRNVVIVGRGRLVGQPSAVWFVNQGAVVTVLTKETWADLSAAALARADIIVSGAGSPGLIKPEMVKDGLIIIDAATSDVSGQIVGDVDPACAEKAVIFSPVPGGVGPITVAMLFKNLVALANPY